MRIKDVTTATTKARMLRKSQTVAESILWRSLRYQKLGVKFRRQEPIDHYIVDFCCVQKRLVIELDGGIHEEEYQRAYDEQRDSHLMDQGFRVLRFKNVAIEQNLELVLKKIKETVSGPLPSTGEGMWDRGHHGG